MASSRARLTDAEWNQHKPYIKRMIIEQDLSQKETIQRLKVDGFVVTKAQLEYKLKIWGFRKKAPKEKSDAVWQLISHRIEKRKRQNKASDIFLNGQLVDPAKARKEINRHQPTSLDRLKQAGMSPKTPESTEVIICTPGSTPVQSLWPICLPWLQYQRSVSLSLAVPSLSELIDHVPKHLMTNRGPAFLDSLLYAISVSKIKYVSCLAAGLDILMPETYEDENRARARLMLCGSAKDVLAEHLNLVLYQVSNRLIYTNIGNGQWLSIFILLEESGITKMALQIGNITDTTLLSVTETLFQEAFHRMQVEYHHMRWYEESGKEDFDMGDSFEDIYEDVFDLVEGYEDWDSVWDADMLEKMPSWRIISWLLASGQNPNTPILFGKEGAIAGKRFTPLQMAANLACSNLIFLLLDANSDPTLIYDEPESFMEMFLRRGKNSWTDKLCLLRRVLERRAWASLFNCQQRASLLVAAFEGFDHDFNVSESEFLDMIIGNELGSLAKYQIPSPLSWITKTSSVLGHAARLLDESFAIRCLSHILGRFSQSNPCLTPVQFVTPDVVLFAASRGHNRVLELLQELHVDLTLCGHRGITALHVAAYYGHSETCRGLLSFGIPVDGHVEFQYIPSPLHLAACNDQLEIIQLLHGHGAQLMRNITQDERQYWSHDIKQLEHKEAINPFGAALFQDSRQICEYFAQHGVTSPPWAAYCEASGRPPRPEVVRLALDMGADPNWTGNDGFSALQAALRQRDIAEFCMVGSAMALLDAGAILNDGEISQAILLEDWTLINRLLEMHCRGISQRQETISVLEVAIAGGSQDLITKTLMQRPGAGAYDAGALCSSIFFGDHGFSAAKHLLDIRPQLPHVLPLESLAIGIAAWRGDADLLDLLLAKFREPSPAKLPPNVFNSNYYHLHDWKTQKRLFWRHETQILASPLSLALSCEESLSRLLDHGFLPDQFTISAAVSLKNNDPLRTLLRYPVISPGLGDYHANDNGPLTEAVSRNNIGAVKCLLDGKYCVNEDNSLVSYGRSPLQMAVECGNLDLIHTLLSAGADVNAPAARYCGATALQLAAIQGYLGITKMLVDLGADVNAPGAIRGGGRTALEGAAEHGRIDTIQYLLSQGCDTNAKGRLSYLRAKRYAELEGHMAAANLLKKWREWTAHDVTLWDKLKFLSRDECEDFIEEDFEDQSASELEFEGDSSGEVHDDDGVRDLVLDDAPTTEAYTPEVSFKEILAGGVISEVDDLETMASDTWEFWNGSLFGR